MRRMRAALAVLVALGLGAAPAPAQYFGQNKVQYQRYSWRAVESEHFRVCFNGGLDSLALRVLDLAEKTDVVSARRLGPSLSRRVSIILCGSQNDFARTNVTHELIGAGPGGLTVRFHDRVVVPFTGSYEDLRHAVVHELSHAFLFDMLCGGSASRLLARQLFCATPLWFIEGPAEYLSLGTEPNAAMFLRDGIVEGTLSPLDHSAGYPACVQGQSAIGYLAGRYGEERLRELPRQVRQSSSFERAFQRVMGLPVRTFDEQWREWLRCEYWPSVAIRQDPERFARRLTDHRRDGGGLNTSPAISPQGDRIAWFSDRRQTTDVYLMSAYDGKALRRIIRGERDVQFGAIPSFRGSIACTRSCSSRSGSRRASDATAYSTSTWRAGRSTGRSRPPATTIRLPGPRTGASWRSSPNTAEPPTSCFATRSRAASRSLRTRWTACPVCRGRGRTTAWWSPRSTAVATTCSPCGSPSRWTRCSPG